MIPPPSLMKKQQPYCMIDCIQGNSIFCQTARNSNDKRQQPKLAQELKQNIPPTCSNPILPKYFLYDKPKPKKQIKIDCQPFSMGGKITSETDLISPQKREKNVTNSFQTPRSKYNQYSKSLLTPTLTQNNTTRIDSAQSFNLDQIIDDLKVELIQGEEGKQQVIENLKDQIKKDYDFQRELKQNKLDELQQLKDEYQKFCQNITCNNLTQVELQQENLLRVNKIQKLEQTIKNIKSDMKSSEARISQLESFDAPKQNRFLKEINKLYRKLEDETDDFCRKYEEENPGQDAYEILKMF